MERQQSTHVPTTYGEAVKIAETVTDAELRDLLPAGTYVYLYPAPRAWQRIGWVERLTGEDGWRCIEWEPPEAHDLPRHSATFNYCQTVMSGTAVIHIPNTGRTIRL